MAGWPCLEDAGSVERGERIYPARGAQVLALQRPLWAAWRPAGPCQDNTRPRPGAALAGRQGKGAAVRGR